VEVRRKQVSWVSRFLHRRPELKIKNRRKIDHLRVKNTNPELLHPWFTSLEAILKRTNVLPINLWNVDETGIALGVCTNHKVIGDARTNHTYVKTPENREWVSIVECISAAGTKVMPVLIFKGKTLQSTWLTPGNDPEHLYTCSERGWTSNEIGIRWLKEVFISETAVSSQQGTLSRVLILDGHGSHVLIDFMKIAWEHNITCSIYPHSSHILQPLDLSCFSVLKSRYPSEIVALASLSNSTLIKKNTFIDYYQKARNEGLSRHVICAGLKATGIHIHSIPARFRTLLRSKNPYQINLHKHQVDILRCRPNRNT